jgi:hypothetical protein
MNTRSPLFWAAVIAIFTLSLVYYKGLTQNASTILPYAIQGASLAVGRNPQTGNYSGYA